MLHKLTREEKDARIVVENTARRLHRLQEGATIIYTNAGGSEAKVGWGG